jgi:hypothetical protein
MSISKVYKHPVLWVGVSLVLLLSAFQNCSPSSFKINSNHDALQGPLPEVPGTPADSSSDLTSVLDSSGGVSLRLALAQEIYRFPILSVDQMEFHIALVVMNYGGEPLGIEDFSVLNRKYDLQSVVQDDFDKNKFFLVFRTDEIRKSLPEKPLYIQRLQKNPIKHGPFIAVFPRLSDPAVANPVFPNPFVSTQRINNSYSMFRNKRVNVNVLTGLISVYEFIDSHQIRFIPLAAFSTEVSGYDFALASHFLVLKDSLSVRVIDLALDRPELVSEYPDLKRCTLQGGFVNCSATGLVYRMSEAGKFEIYTNPSDITGDVLAFPDSTIFLERAKVYTGPIVYFVRDLVNPGVVLDSFTLVDNNCKGRWFDGTKIVCASDNNRTSLSVIYLKNMAVDTVQSNSESNANTCSASVEVFAEAILTQDFCSYGNLFQMGDQQSPPIRTGTVNASGYFTGVKLWAAGYTIMVIAKGLEYRSFDGIVVDKITPMGDEISALLQ